jgi:metal-responsive CopG/Arc/MetJ family transcriptional regulator
MKTAISIPDPVFHEAEAYARRHRLSRSALYAEAVKTYVGDRRPQEVTRQLDEVYSKESSDLDAVLGKMQAGSLRKEVW